MALKRKNGSDAKPRAKATCRLCRGRRSKSLRSRIKTENFSNSNLFLTTAAGLSRPREAVAIVDCWIWQIATENLFSKSLIRQRQLFATANNSRTQISLPRRHRLKGRNSQIDKKIRGRFPTTSYLETHCEFLSNPNLNK